MGFSPKVQEQAADTFLKLYKIFMEKDATMVEINPMSEVSTGDGGFERSEASATTEGVGSVEDVPN